MNYGKLQLLFLKELWADMEQIRQNVQTLIWDIIPPAIEFASVALRLRTLKTSAVTAMQVELIRNSCICEDTHTWNLFLHEQLS
jgi:hypothetical protein